MMRVGVRRLIVIMIASTSHVDSRTVISQPPCCPHSSHPTPGVLTPLVSEARDSVPPVSRGEDLGAAY
jgi:hypothetical protein